jgi:hypothetical protein
MSGAEILFTAALATAAYGSYQGGRAQAFQYKAEAEQAKTSARDAEIARRQKLLQVLAERQVATAAGGATLEGTPGTIINASEQAANMDALSLEGMTASRVSSLNAAARNARTVANINAASNLIMGGAQVLGALGAGPKETVVKGASSGASPPGALGRITPKGGAGLVPR